MVLALFIAVGALGFVLATSKDAVPGLPLRDFAEYWAAGRLLGAGENPYDRVRVAELEAQAGSEEAPVLMWNPPWALPFVLPLGWMPVKVGHAFWLLVQLAALGVSADLLWRCYGGPPDYRLVGTALTLLLVPSLAAVLMGQISALVLLGAALFLYLMNARRDFAAGFAASLLGIKPHLAWLFWLALLLWVVRTGRWRVILGGVLGGLLLTGIAMSFRPGILAEYFSTLAHRQAAEPGKPAASALSAYVSPTLGTLLRRAAGGGSFAWQFVPMIPGLVWLAWYWLRRREIWDWPHDLPVLVFVSLITAPYGAWLFDLVVHVPAVVAVAAPLVASGDRARGWTALAAYLGVNAAALVQIVLFEMEFLAFIWISPVMLAAYLLLLPRDGTRTTPTLAGPETGTA